MRLTTVTADSLQPSRRWYGPCFRATCSKVQRTCLVASKAVDTSRVAPSEILRPVERRGQWIAFAPGTGDVHVSKGDVSKGDDQLAQDAGQYRLTLTVDYSAEMPLWGRDAHRVVLEPMLLERLRAWQSDFDHNFHYEQGWLSREARERWATEAVKLEADLRDALPGVELKVDLWPLTPSSK